MNQSCRRWILSTVLVCFVAASAACTPPTTPWQKYNDAGRAAYREAQWSGNKLKYYPEAEKNWVAGLKEAEKFGPQDPRLGISLNNLAVLYEEQLKFSQAEPLCERAIAFDERTLGPNHQDVADKQRSLALMYMSEGKFMQAEPLYKRLLEINEKTYGPNDLKVSFSLDTLADVYAMQGNFAPAELLYKRSLAILKEEHAKSFDTTFRKYADLLVKTNRKAEAEKLAKSAGVDLSQKPLSPTDVLLRRLRSKETSKVGKSEAGSEQPRSAADQ